MRRMTLSLALAVTAASLVACGGGGGGGGGDNSSGSTPVATAPPPPQANSLAITIDAGPAALAAANEIAANTLFASVTVCTPGSTTACKTIDHVQVDTGSIGLRLIASTLGSAVPAPSIDATTSRPLLECVQFADGYSFGSVGTLDVTLGGRSLPSLPVNIIGDPAAGNAPPSCVSGPSESTVLEFGANGIIGVGNFLQDCGPACAQTAIAGTYYVCPAGGAAAACTPTTVATNRQVPNPVSRLTADNNGVVVQLPSVPELGATTINGTLLFGVATQSDNALAAATSVYKLTSTGTLTVIYNAIPVPGSFIDSGSNAYFFGSAIRTCPDASFFYCPVAANSTPTSLTQSATVVGTNNVSTTVSFTVDNADQLFNTTFTAFPGLAGPNGDLQASSATAFDLGLPFFFGRNVYVVIEGNTVGGVTGPAIAF